MSKATLLTHPYLLCVGEYRAKLAIKEFYQKEKIKNKKQVISF